MVVLVQPDEVALEHGDGDLPDEGDELAALGHNLFLVDVLEVGEVDHEGAGPHQGGVELVLQWRWLGLLVVLVVVVAAVVVAAMVVGKLWRRRLNVYVRRPQRATIINICHAHAEVSQCERVQVDCGAQRVAGTRTKPEREVLHRGGKGHCSGV